LDPQQGLHIMARADADRIGFDKRPGERPASRRLSVRSLIITVAVAASLPGLLAGGLILFQLWRAEQDSTQALLLEAARQFSLVVDSEVGSVEQELMVLTHFDPAQMDQFASMARSSAKVVGGAPSWITLIDASGREIFNTLRSQDTARLEPDNVGIAQAVIETGRPSISNVFVSTLVPRAVVAIAVPVIRSGKVKYVLQMTLPIDQFAAVLQRANLPAGWLAVVVDRQGSFVARRPLNEPGRSTQSALVDNMRQSDEAVYDHLDFEGAMINGAFTRSKLSGWSAGVGLASEAIEAPFRRSLFELGAAAVLLAVAGVLLAWRLAGRLDRSVASLSRAADALGCGSEPVTAKAGIREIEQIGGALVDAAELLKRRSMERDWALDSLHKANQSLEERVHERTRDLVRANQRLSAEMEQRQQVEQALTQKRKMQAIGEITAAIAHDFNNFLTAVIGNLEMLRGRIGDERAQRLAERALNAAELGAVLTKQLLAFGSKQRLETTVVDLNSLISSAAPLLGRAAGPLVDLEIGLATGSCMIAVDPTQLELALLNLAMNSRDAMPEGGRLTIETQWLSVTNAHPQLAPGEWAVVSIRDTGEGMAPEVVARAFEPFFTTKTTGRASGLGLSIVYGLVKQLGGEVAVTSELGMGTMVQVYLPRAGYLAPKVAPTFPALRQGPSPRVLLADDNEDVLAVMATVLRNAGHRVVEASDGPTAVDLFGDGVGFDAVVLDYAMPGMKGTAAARAIRAIRPDVPILLVTGFAEAMAPGEWPAESILHKPFRPDRLRQRLEELIAARRDGASDKT
jgi:signal transduction histidine kinase